MLFLPNPIELPINTQSKRLNISLIKTFSYFHEWQELPILLKKNPEEFEKLISDYPEIRNIYEETKKELLKDITVLWYDLGYTLGKAKAFRLDFDFISNQAIPPVFVDAYCEGQMLFPKQVIRI